MAGELERLQWVLELGLDDRAFLAGLERIKAELATLTARAATPGSGAVTGTGTAAAPALAAQTAALQASVDQLFARAADAAGTSISRSLVQELAALTNGGVIGAVGAALGTRTTGAVSSDKFTVASQAALEKQVAALAAATTGQTAQTAATQRVVAAETQKAIATEASTSAELTENASLVQAARARVEAATEQVTIAKAQVEAAKASLAAEEQRTKAILEAAAATKAAADRAHIEQDALVAEQKTKFGEAQRAVGPAKDELVIAQTGLESLPPDASKKETRSLEGLVAEKQAELETAKANAAAEKAILDQKQEILGELRARARLAAADLTEIQGAQKNALNEPTAAVASAQEEQKAAVDQQREATRQEALAQAQMRRDQADARKQQIDDEKAAAKEDLDARREASAKFIDETYAPVAEAAAGGRPPIIPPFGALPPGGGIGGDGGGRIPPPPGGGGDAEEVLRQAQQEAAAAFEKQKEQVLNSLISLRELINNQQALISAQAEETATIKAINALRNSQTSALLAGDRPTIEANAANAAYQRAAQIQQQALQAQGFGLERLAPAILTPEQQQATAGDPSAARAAILQALNEEKGATQASARLARAQAATVESQILNTDENKALLIQESVQRNALNRALKAEVAAAEKASFEQRVASGEVGPGTLTQRLEAAIASRQGGNFRAPQEFGTLSQVLESGFLTTARFAVSGIATYAAFAGLQKMLTDGIALEKTLQQIRAEFDALGQGNQFAGFHQGILDISRSTGEAANNVAQLALQFKGAFGATLNNSQILGQVQSAVELARVTGISLSEIENNLTGVAVTYGTTVQHVGDVVLALQDRTGVGAKESIQALSDMSVAAQQAGLSVEQATAIIDVAAKYTGQSGASVAEGLNRILPGIETKASQIVTLFEQAAPQKLPEVTQALAAGDTGKVLQTLLGTYNNLSKAQQDYVASLLGSRRDAKTFIDVAVHYNEVLADQRAALDSNGRLARSYAALQDSVAQQLAKVVAQFKLIGAAILSLGLSDVIQIIAKGVALLIQDVSTVIGVFGAFNNALGGIPARLLEVYAALRLLTGIAGVLGQAGLIGGLAKVVNVVPGVNVGKGAAAGETGAVRSAATIDRAAVTEEAVATGVVFSNRGQQAVYNALKSTGTFVEEQMGRFGTTIAASGIGLGTAVETAATRAGALITGTGTLLGRALTSFGQLIAQFAPILAIIALTTEISSTIQGANDANRRQQALQQTLGNYSVSQITSGQFSQGDQTAVDDYLKKYTSDRTLGVKDLIHPTEIFKNAGAVLSGTKSPDQLAADQVQAQTTKAFATVLTQQFKPADLQKILAESNQGLPLGGSALSLDDINKIAKQGTTDDKQFQKIIDAFTAAARTKKGLGAAYQAIIGPQQKIQTQLGELSKGLEDLPQLEVQQSTGQITDTSFVQQATHLADITRNLLLDAIAKHADPTYINNLKTSLDKETSDRDKVLDARLKGLAAINTVAQSVSGEPTAIANVQNIAAGIAALQAPNALQDPNITAIAEDLVKKQAEQVQYLAAHASSWAEAQNILAKGFKIDPAEQAALNIGVLRNLPDPYDSALKDAISKTQGDFQTVIQGIVSAQGGIKVGLQKYIDFLTDTYKKMLLTGADPKTRAELKNDIDKLNALKNSNLFVGDTGVPTPEDPTKVAKDTADRQIANAKRLAQISGASPQAADLSAQAAALNALKVPNLSPDDKLNIADQFLTAQRNVLDYVASKAQGTAKSIAILKAGVPIPPQIQELLAESQISALPQGTQSVLDEAAKALGENSIKEINDILAANKKGEDGLEKIREQVILKIRNIIHAAVFLGAQVDSKQFHELLQAAADLQGQIDKGGPDQTAALTPVPTVNQGDPSQYTAPSSDTPQARAEGLVAIQAAQAHGDPLLQARAALAAANVAKQYAKGQAENLQADAQIISANNQIQDAIVASAKGNIDVLKAAVGSDNPLLVAQLDKQQADFELQNAATDQARQQALIHEFNANHAIRDAIISGIDSQHQLMQAIATARGDVIGAAKVALDQAYEDYFAFIAQGGDKSSPKGLDLYRNIVQQQAAVRDTTVTQNESDIQFALDLHQISTAQAIARLEGLKAQAEGNKQLFQDLERKIYDLKTQAGKDLQFNLPNIILPTAYEARRISQLGPQGIQSAYLGNNPQYTDNRQITVTVVAQTNASPSQIAAAVANQMNKPSTFGAGTRLY